MKVYCAGPYSGGDTEENVQTAIRAANELLDAGFMPFVPHLGHYMDIQHPRPYEAWMSYDLEWLACCDALLRLPGVSPGADREEAAAHSWGIPVFRSVAEVLEAYP